MLKVVLQDGAKDCGVSCLLSIIRFYGGEVSKEYLRKITNTNKDGVSAYNLIEAAKSLGMDSYGAVGEIKNIDKDNLPCIAHVNINPSYQHFVVIYKIDSKKVLIMDPAIGKRILKLSEFKLMSTGNYIFMKANKKLPTFINKKIIKKFILSFIKKNKLPILLLSIISINLLILEIILAFNFKYLVSYCISYNNSINLNKITILLLFISLLLFILTAINKKMLYKVIFIFDDEITFSTFKQLLLLPYFYYKNRTVGEVLSRFNDLSIIKEFLIKSISLIIDIFSLFIFIIFLLNINKYLCIFLIIYFFVVFIFIFIRNNRKKKLFSRLKLNQDNIQNYIVESISNVDTTKSCHLEKKFTDIFLLKYKKLLNINYKYLNYVEFNNNFFKLIKNLLLIITYSIGCLFIIKGKFSLENMIIFISFFQYSLNYIDHILLIIEDISSFKVCVKRVEELYSIMEEEFNQNYFYYKYRLNGSIKFNNLFYSINNKVILDGVNFCIENTDKVLLFGNSGSGKSTLVKMLLRYVDVPYSMININGIDINHYHLENIRSYTSYVSSNEMLFNDTIYNNICLHKDVSEDDFIKVIKICRVDKIFGVDINNYKKMIEENGFLLSSGERQRIILARSLLRDSDIYIYDEAFGQIDIDLTNKIINDMFLYLKDKTVIVISHRNNSKKYFNRIIKLESGKLIEK